MKRLTLSLVALVALAMPANAQNFLDLGSWQHWNLNTMSTDEQARITAGLKNGSLTQSEASRLQDRLNKINNLKARLSVNGLNNSERLRLDAELDNIAQQIYKESTDGQRNNWLGKKPWDWTRGSGGGRLNNYMNLNAWQHWNLDTMTTDEEARINAGVRNGSITRDEANRLRMQLNRVNDLKRQLSIGGMSPAERMKLDSEIDKLAERIYKEGHDGDRSRWLGKKPVAWTSGWRPTINKNQWKRDNRDDLRDVKRDFKDDRKDWKHDNRNDWKNKNDNRPGPGITRNEARDLQQDQRQLNKKEERMRESGNGLSAKEERKLERKQDKLERKVRRDRND
jgi:hypothetical protein